MLKMAHQLRRRLLTYIVILLIYFRLLYTATRIFRGYPHVRSFFAAEFQGECYRHFFLLALRLIFPATHAFLWQVTCALTLSGTDGRYSSSIY